MNPLSTLPPRFINWALSPDGVKLPVGLDGKTINAMEPANWKTLEQAQQCKYPLAYVVTEKDNLFFLDLDKCLQDDGNWSVEATQIFQSFPGAMYEISQSGTGLHIMGKCNPLVLADRKNRWDGWKELYVKDRFVAFGPHGWHWNGTPDPGRDHTHTLRTIAPQREWQADGGVTEATGRDPEWSGPEDDDELLQRALASTGGAMAAFGQRATFKQLWEADDALANFYPAENDRPDKRAWDHSRADGALLAQLAFWTGKDWARMDRLFRRSALMRPKWDRMDYRSKSVSEAIQMTSGVYKQSSRSEAPGATDSAVVSSDTFMTISEQITYFNGCIYVRDQNKMFMPDGTLVSDRSFAADKGGYIFQIDPSNAGATSRTKNAFEAFTQNRGHAFPKCYNITFDPTKPTGEIIDNNVNMWVKPKVIAREGDVTPFLDLMRLMLPNDQDRAIILNFMASMVQNPGVKFRWAPVVQGGQGNGKTFMSRCLSYAVGDQVTHRPASDNLGEKYNGFLENRLLIVVEEIYAADRREMLEMMKPWITNDEIEVRRMATEKRMVRNFANFILLTNHKDGVTVGKNDRRYAIFYTAQQTEDDVLATGMTGEYWANMHEWFNAEGKHAIAAYLQNFQIDPALDPAGACNRAPRTSSTDEAIKSSLGRVEAEIIEAIESNVVGFRGGWVSSWAMSRLFQERGIKVARNKWRGIMEGIGFEPCGDIVGGRSPFPIFQEANSRPTLFIEKGKTGTVEDYSRAQGYGI